jgi:Sec-independent protein translocase protein TatA
MTWLYIIGGIIVVVVVLLVLFGRRDMRRYRRLRDM